MPGSTLRRRVIRRSSFLLYRLLGVDLRPQLCDGHVERLQVRLQALDLLLSFLQGAILRADLVVLLIESAAQRSADPLLFLEIAVCTLQLRVTKSQSRPCLFGLPDGGLGAGFSLRHLIFQSLDRLLHFDAPSIRRSLTLLGIRGGFRKERDFRRQVYDLVFGL